MSKQQNTNNFPDASGKVIDDDKCGSYESSRTDSGFISSEIHSEDIPQSESGLQRDSGTQHSRQDKDTEEHMRVDSGVCLSESFSSLNIKQGLNDLNRPRIISQTPVESFTKRPKEDTRWMTFYQQDEDGNTELHTAIVEGLVEKAELVIKAAPHPRLLDTPNDDAQTPLHLAVLTCQSQLARRLIVAGARPCPRDLRGDSPLHIAAQNGDTKCVEAIAYPVQQKEWESLTLSYQGPMYQPCDLDQWNYLGQTCVHVAAMHGHAQVLRDLAWYGADMNAREGCMGYTALHYAVERRDEAIFRTLLECKTIDVHTVTYGGHNALELSVILPSGMRQALRNRGLPSPYSSEDDDDFDSEDELTYENSLLFTMPMVNASA